MNMKKFAILSVFALIAVPCLTTLAHANCPEQNCLWYGGDLDLNDPNQNGLANENDAIVSGNPYGAATYQSFVIPKGQTWDIESVFTNNLISFTPTSGYYEIRSGMSEGNGGTLLLSGMVTGQDLSFNPTGRSDFGYTEYEVDAHFKSVDFGPGTYWYAMVPICTTCNGRSFNSNANTHLNSVGIQEDGDSFFNSGFFGANYTNANNEGVFNNFSGGIDGTIVPEPSSLIMLGSGLLAAAGVVRRRLSR